MPFALKKHMDFYRKYHGKIEPLVDALEISQKALDGSLRSAGQSTAGWLAGRRQMARAEKQARTALDKISELTP